MGIWDISIRHYKKPTDEDPVVYGVMVNDQDVERGILFEAFERAIDAVKDSINKKNKKGVKNG